MITTEPGLHSGKVLMVMETGRIDQPAPLYVVY
jgi:hypothetical protein